MAYGVKTGGGGGGFVEVFVLLPPLSSACWLIPLTSSVVSSAVQEINRVLEAMIARARINFLIFLVLKFDIEDSISILFFEILIRRFNGWWPFFWEVQHAKTEEKIILPEWSFHPV